MSRPLSMSEGMEVLEAWASRNNLGDELYALGTETLYAQTMLDFATSKETENPWLDALLLRLQLLVQDGYAVLNELDYFRVQEQLHGNSSRGVKGCIDRLRVAARAAVATLKPSSSSSLHNNAEFMDKLAYIDLSSTCCVGNGLQDVKKAPKPKFNRVLLSTKITKIVEKLNSLSAKVSKIVDLKLLSARSAS